MKGFGGPNSKLFLVLEIKFEEKIFFVGGNFFSWEGCDTLLLNSFKPSQTYEKLHRKGEPYRFRALKDPSVQTDRRTDPVTFI